MNIALDKSAFGYTVADITRLFRRVFDRRAAHLELTRAQWRALSRIERLEGLSQSALAEELEMEAIAVGRVQGLSLRFIECLAACLAVRGQTGLRAHPLWSLKPEPEL